MGRDPRTWAIISFFQGTHEEENRLKMEAELYCNARDSEIVTSSSTATQNIAISHTCPFFPSFFLPSLLPLSLPFSLSFFFFLLPFFPAFFPSYFPSFPVSFMPFFLSLKRNVCDRNGIQKIVLTMVLFGVSVVHAYRIKY